MSRAGSTCSVLGLIGLALASASCGSSGDSTPATTAVPDAGAATPDAPTSGTPATLSEILQAYLSAWEQPDAAQRGALLAKSYAPDGTYADPTSTASNPDELSKIIGDFLGKNPGAKAARTSGVDRHHQSFRFTWAFTSSAGAKIVEGTAFGALAGNGRIQRIVGFFGAQPTTGASVPAVDGWASAWSEPVIAKRRDYLSAAFSPTGTFTDPTAEVNGRDAVLTVISAFRSTNPRAKMSVVGAPDKYGSNVRFAWRLTKSTAPTEQLGTSMILLDGAVIKEITSFDDPVPAHE